MKEKIIFDFDINKVRFEEAYKDQRDGATMLFFIAPKEWLNGRYPEVIHAELVLAYYVPGFQKTDYSTMMSPTRVNNNGDIEDYDWFDVELRPSEVDALIDLYKSSVTNVGASVPENLWTKVAEYCDNDVIATEAVFNARKEW